jgi:hypothetical protein
MSELSLNLTVSGSAKINFSLNFEPNSKSCENLTVSVPAPTTNSDLNTVRAPTPVCLIEENGERLVNSVALSGSDGNIDTLFDFDENELNSVLFGVDWGNVPSLSMSPDNRSLDNVALSLDNVAVAGSSTPFNHKDVVYDDEVTIVCEVTNPRDIKSEPL